jgi:chorismate synthase
MRGNQFGKLFSLTSFGESHGPAMGVVLDGFPAGISVDLEELKNYLARRSPGKNAAQSSRQEPDEPEILSGIYLGKSLGTPITVMVKNIDARSSDYDKLKDQYRPGHADKTTELKYGVRDHRGGGRASGRETLSRVIAGYFAKLILPQLNIKTTITQIGPKFFNEHETEKINNYLVELKNQGDSAGGTVSVKIENPPAGLGEPCFDKLKADLAKGMLSIGSCVGFSYGKGQEFATLLGSQISCDIKNFGGIEGGISNGETIEFQLTFKAPSTIGKNAKEGRHDPCILPRALVVIESMSAIVLADHFLRQKAYQVGEQ